MEDLVEWWLYTKGSHQPCPVLSAVLDRTPCVDEGDSLSKAVNSNPVKQHVNSYTVRRSLASHLASVIRGDNRIKANSQKVNYRACQL